MKLTRIFLTFASALALSVTPALAYGFTPVKSFQGELDTGYSLKHYVTLYAGYDYRVEGWCDKDCTDMDLELYDMYGNLALSDHGDSDVPSLNFQVNTTGEFILKVSMYDCAWKPCSYNVQVSER